MGKSDPLDDMIRSMIKHVIRYGIALLGSSPQPGQGRPNQSTPHDPAHVVIHQSIGTAAMRPPPTTRLVQRTVRVKVLWYLRNNVLMQPM